MRLHFGLDLAEALLDVEQDGELIGGQAGEQLELLVIELSQIKAGGAKPLERIWSVVVVAHLDLLQDGVSCHHQDHLTRLSAG